MTLKRIGKSQLSYDFSNLMATSRIDKTEMREAWKKLSSRFDNGEIGFFQAPFQSQLSEATLCESLASQLLATQTFKDVLFLGIGGSALGPITLLSALKHLQTSELEFHFSENPDPTDWKMTLSKLKPESTLVVVVAKSGTTFETLAQLLVSLEWLKKERWSSHVVAITDPAKGDLRKFADANKIPTLPIAPSIGGRFSVFTPVGLFAAALAGISVGEFLSGANQMRISCLSSLPEENPIFQLATLLLSLDKTHPIHVCMPYSSLLKNLGLWFVQLWGESLGKNGKGFTPLAALGAVDQHSILQLLRDGPNDKVTNFISVKKSNDAINIPNSLGQEIKDYPAFEILTGHTFEYLMRAEREAIEQVLTNQKRPNFTLEIDELSESAIGSLLFFYSILTAYTGTLMGVDPFDQPGVEEGKVYIRESLKKS